MALLPCPTCSRHVRSTEARCPFCSAGLELGETPEPLLPAERVGRSSMLAFQSLVRAGLVAATSGVIAACTETSPVPAYGAPFEGVGGIGGSSAGAPSGAGRGSGAGGLEATAGTSGEGGAGGEGGR